MSPPDRKKVARNRAIFSPLAVRCVCITASCVALACALLALGAACVVIPASSRHAGPCPQHFIVVAFGSAGGLLVVSAILFAHLCSIRNRESVLASEASLPAPCDSPVEDQQVCDVTNAFMDQDFKEDKDQRDFTSAQKSADVSYWIEQQKSAGEECLPLESDVRVAAQDSDAESSEVEITPL